MKLNNFAIDIDELPKKSIAGEKRKAFDHKPELA